MATSGKNDERAEATDMEPTPGTNGRLFKAVCALSPDEVASSLREIDCDDINAWHSNQAGDPSTALLEVINSIRLQRNSSTASPVVAKIVEKLMEAGANAEDTCWHSTYIAAWGVLCKELMS